MLRATLIALSGLAYFIISILLMMPLRMMKEPIVNYNLFFGPFLFVLFAFLFYRCCTVEKESKAYIYGFFAGIVCWQIFGELASMRLDEGVITQFSDVDIKGIGGYFYLIGGWLLLKVLWLTKSIKNSVAVFALTFLCIWTFELYMDNYSMQIPTQTMPVISYTVGALALITTILLLVIAKKSTKAESQTVMGCLLYISLSLVLMGFGPWTKPQTFYIKHHGKHISHQIEQLKKDQLYLNQLRQQMLNDGLLKPEDDTTSESVSTK